MKKNIGSLDKIIRLGLAVIFIVVGILVVSSLLWLSIICFVLAVIMIVTSLASRCSLYYPLHINTRKKEEEKPTE